MSKSTMVATACVVLCWLALTGCTDPSKPASGPGQSQVPGQSQDLGELVAATALAETDILPHTKGTITPGRNCVYCGTFQLAWNEMWDTFVKAPILLEGDLPMVELLNRRDFQASDLADDCYLAAAGSVKDGIVERLRQELKERFPNADMEVPDAEEETLIYAYAYLEKTLPFRAAFDRLEEPLNFPKGDNAAPVAAFGTESFTMNCRRDEILEDQVTVLSYTSDDEFVLRLNSTSKDDEIILAKIPPKETLAETIADARQRIEQGGVAEYKQTLQPEESLIIPVVSLNVHRKYTELIERHLKNEGLTELYVTEASQGIRFRLDETGAKLSSEAEFGIGSDLEQPRHFVFDKPFLLYLKEKDSNSPYFAIWIETAEVLEKAP